MANPGESVRIVYEENEGHPVLPVTGAYGGPSPDGASIVAHAYVDFGTVPSIEEHEVNADGLVLVKDGNVIKRADITRSVQCSLVFSPESAKRFGEWLLEKSDLAFRARSDDK